MAIIRPVRPEEMNQAVRLSDLVFRDSEQASMGTAFPLVFSTSLGQSFGAFEEDRLVSFIGIVPAVMRIGDAKVKIYSLGSVCTHPDFRGKGHAGAILKAVQEHVGRTGASLLFVSGDRPLYSRARCYPFGSVRRYTITAEQAAAVRSGRLPEALIIRELEPRDWFQLHQLAASRGVAYEQSITELAVMIESEAYASCVKHRHVALAAERDGELLACAVISVPSQYASDKTPFVVERFGDDSLNAALAAYAVENYGLDKLDVTVSWFENELQKTMEPVEYCEEANDGTVHVIDPGLIIQQLTPYLLVKNETLSSMLQITRLDEDRCRIALNGPSAELTARQLVSLLFDITPNYEADELLKSQLSALFPVPLPYTSGLNYV